MSEFDRVLAEERHKDALHLRLAELQHERARGVCWSGCGPGPLPAPRSERELHDAASARFAARRDWRSSGAGRLSAAVGLARRAAEQAHLAAEAARAALARADSSTGSRCREAADLLEAQGRNLIAAARAARMELPDPAPGAR